MSTVLAVAVYLVLFVADPAHDGHADALRAAARSVPGAGFFDDTTDDVQRTVGAYLRTDDPAGAPAAALVAAVGAVGKRLATRFEVQYAEAVVGHLHDGRPDAGVARMLGDIPEAP